MSNREYIEKYKDTDEIIKTYYAMRDRYGRNVNVDGIVNPLKIDNRQLASVTDQQGTTPHCAAYSICNLCEAIIWKRTGKLINLNADQVYAHAKLIDGDEDQEGTYLECAIKAAMKLGGFQSQIDIGMMDNDRTDRTVEKIKYLIHKYDFIHCGFQIKSNWSECNMENPIIDNTGYNMGGHAVLVVGYDQDGVYIQNSWGKEWGASGFGILKWNDFKQSLIYACFL